MHAFAFSIYHRSNHDTYYYNSTAGILTVEVDNRSSPFGSECKIKYQKTRKIL